MTYENILLDREEDIALLTFNRHKALTPLNASTIRELDAALDEVAADDSIKALVITGAGDKAFVAGADITEIRALPSAKAGLDMCRRGQTAFFKVEKLDKPVIIAINGFAMGGCLLYTSPSPRD